MSLDSIVFWLVAAAVIFLTSSFLLAMFLVVVAFVGAPEDTFDVDIEGNLPTERDNNKKSR